VRLRLLGDAAGVFVSLAVGVEALTFSGSSGAGGGVVSIVQPIHPEITKTRSTNSRTGIPMAHHCQFEFWSPGMKGEKNATKYTMSTIMDTRNIANP
jgi:hypothetical protein